jgi:protein-S-isoprenylcysteine O-methyltransferase Ste14
MISTLVLFFFLALILLIAAVIARSIIQKNQLFGRPPIPVFFFVLAKVLVVVNLAFLLMKGLAIPVARIFEPGTWTDLAALALLAAGTVILFLSAIRLNRDLVFGLSSAKEHHLQTTGVFAISRHPFYLGFIFILFASCLFTPNYLNIAAFIGAWTIHHFIMIKEEEHLLAQYGEEYRQYAARVNRYITF